MSENKENKEIIQVSNESGENAKFGAIRELIKSLDLLRFESIHYYKDLIIYCDERLSHEDISKEDRRYYEDTKINAINSLREAEKDQSANIIRGIGIVGGVIIAAVSPKWVPRIKSRLPRSLPKPSTPKNE